MADTPAPGFSTLAIHAGAQPDPAGPLVQVRRRIRPPARDLGLRCSRSGPAMVRKLTLIAGTLDQNKKKTMLFKFLC